MTVTKKKHANSAAITNYPKRVEAEGNNSGFNLNILSSEEGLRLAQKLYKEHCNGTDFKQLFPFMLELDKLFQKYGGSKPNQEGEEYVQQESQPQQKQSPVGYRPESSDMGTQIAEFLTLSENSEGTITKDVY